MPFRKKFVYRPRSREQWEARIRQGEGPAPEVELPKKIKIVDPVKAGRKGGRARSDKKRRSSRRNGKLGGRKPSRTLAERLLGQKLKPEQREALAKKQLEIASFIQKDRAKVTEFFGADFEDVFQTTTWRRKTGRMNQEVRDILEKWRVLARQELRKLKQTVPKDYVIVTKFPSDAERIHWQERFRRRTDVPEQPPPHLRKKRFTKFKNWHLIEAAFKDNHDLTPAELIEVGGAEVCAHVVPMLTYLRWKYPDNG